MITEARNNSIRRRSLQPLNLSQDLQATNRSGSALFQAKLKTIMYQSHSSHTLEENTEQILFHLKPFIEIKNNNAGLTNNNKVYKRRFPEYITDYRSKYKLTYIDAEVKRFFSKSYKNIELFPPIIQIQSVTDTKLPIGLSPRLPIDNSHLHILKPTHYIVNFCEIMHSPSKPPTHINGFSWKSMNDERNRLCTFKIALTEFKVSAIQLAKNGFVYMGEGKNDRAMCFFCLAVKENWNECEIIPQLHIELSPNCPLANDRECGNKPMAFHYPKEGLQLFNKIIKKRLNHDNETDGRSNTTRKNNQISSGAHFGNHYIGATRVSQQTDRTQQSNISNASSNPSSELSSSGSEFSTSSARPFTDDSHRPAVSVSSSGSGTTQSTVPSNSGTVVTSSVASNTSTTTSTNILATTTPTQNTSTSASRDNANNTTQVNQSSTNAANQGWNTTQPNQGSCSNQPSPSTSQAAVPANPTYQQLGIITEKPKRFEFAVWNVRFQTFEGWPPQHNLKPTDLADAGFYYAGYSDCARCFYCGGGLRNWEPNDDVWVEHARWFPKCAFIKQNLGQTFIDTVQDLNKTQDEISFDNVKQKMGNQVNNFHLDVKGTPLKRDPAVLSVKDMGYDEKDVLTVANKIKEDGDSLSSDKIFEKLMKDKHVRRNTDRMPDASVSTSNNSDKDKATINSLKEQNSELRQQTACKICMDKEIAVVFLPCGHFVSCTDCSPALKDCPVCRQSVKGIVRAYMS